MRIRRLINRSNKKRRNQTILKSALILLLLSIGLSSPSASATLDDLVGDWSVQIKTTFTVYGQFTETDVTSATCTFNSNGTYLLTEDDYGTLRYYPGTFHLNNKGTKIFFTLDKAARKAIKLSLTDWLEEIAWDNGYDIGGINFRLEQITLYSAEISAVTNQPTKAIVEISGKVSAYVDGVYTMKDFYRKTVVKFLYRL